MFSRTSSPQSLFQNTFQYIKKNRVLPARLAAISDHDPNAIQLLDAIHTGNAGDKIFSDPDCSLLLLHLMQQESLSYTEGITVFFYLTALRQFSDQQPLAARHQHYKLPSASFGVESITQNGMLTDAGKYFLTEVIEKFSEDTGWKMKDRDFKTFVTQLPPAEQWLLKIPHAVNPRRARNCYDNFINAIVYNVPFFADNYLTDADKKITCALIPSFSIIGHCLNAFANGKPMDLQPIFGTVGLLTLRKLHDLQDEQPVALYLPPVQSSMTEADGYRAGPFAVGLHDIGHAFWASLLKKEDRQFIYRECLPCFDSLLLTVRTVNADSPLIAFLEDMQREINDFDLTPLQQFKYTKDRLQEYLSRIFKLCLNNHREALEENEKIPEPGKCLLDSLLYLLATAACQAKQKQQLQLAAVFHSFCIKLLEGTWRFTLFPAMGNAVMAAARQSVFPTEIVPPLLHDSIRWETWLSLMNNREDSTALWSAACIRAPEELIILMTECHLPFFDPWLPMTETLRKRFVYFLEKNRQEKPASLPISLGKRGFFSVSPIRGSRQHAHQGIVPPDKMMIERCQHMK